MPSNHIAASSVGKKRFESPHRCAYLVHEKHDYQIEVFHRWFNALARRRWLGLGLVRLHNHSSLTYTYMRVDADVCIVLDSTC